MTETFLQMAERHRAADMLMQGDFEMHDGKACSVGCFNHDLGSEADDFAALAKFSGYPEWTHHLQEAVFENLPKDASKNWHVDFARACEGVTDWVAVYHQTMIAALEIALPHDKSGYVQRVIDLHKQGPEVTQDQWTAARAAARDSARAAADAAAWAARAARAAAWSQIAQGFIKACEANK